jgi:hypothetical protein
MVPKRIHHLYEHSMLFFTHPKTNFYAPSLLELHAHINWPLAMTAHQRAI